MDKQLNQKGMTLLGPVTLLLSLVITALLLCNKMLLSAYAIKTVSLFADKTEDLAHNRLNRLRAALLNTENTIAIVADGQRVIGEQRVEINDMSLPLLSLEGQARMHNSERTIVESVIKSPLLLNIPSSPLSISTFLPRDAKIELALPEPLVASGKFFSLWSAKSVSTETNQQVSCIWDDFIQGECQLWPLSSSAHPGNDFFIADTQFPSDLIRFLFGVETASLGLIENYSATLIENCHALNEGSSGLFVVSTDCTVAALSEVGTVTNPVLVIAKNNTLKLGSDVVFHGLYVGLCLDSAISYDIIMHSSAFIDGALMTNCAVSSQSSIRVSYNPSLLTALQGIAKLQQLHRIPGSWRDF
ncbi:hypothetical protein [Alteromonas ponticola]|uniref:Polymer-forming cytoskeletal protein n=1 Tax=Alteromonas ponticola TaxID=2720613 RepID=A0ABX1QXI5_9ALTE|nr:hypothetical protein [Alteromonas ponticola]NMH58954.1 hypothetical protein [Alteromonas ponticola]